MATTDPLTCIHAETGLCDQCREDFAEDSDAFREYGPHTDGIRNAQALAAELAARGPDDGGPTPDDVPLRRRGTIGAHEGRAGR